MFNDILDSIMSNATQYDIEVIREKLNNHLVNYIYNQDIAEELSNEFDDSFCHHCHSLHIIKYEKDKKGNQRYYCKDCYKTFSIITGSLLAYTKKEPIKTKRGMSDQKRNIACALDIHNHKVIQVSEKGRIHSEKLIEIHKNKIPSQCKVVSDSLRSYQYIR